MIKSSNNGRNYKARLKKNTSKIKKCYRQENIKNTIETFIN